MSYPRRHPLVTLLLLAGYLTAGTASGLLHEHGHDAARCEPTSHEHDSSDHGEADSDCDDREGFTAAHAPHDDDCVVCRFVGQRVIPAAIGQLDRACDLCTLLAVVRWSAARWSTPRTTHSRAPPVFG